MVVMAIFKEMLLQKQSNLQATSSKINTEVDWIFFLLILGKPGTGKTHTLHACIEYCLTNRLQVCVGTPTRTLARVYSARYHESVNCDTLHSIF